MICSIILWCLAILIKGGSSSDEFGVHLSTPRIEDNLNRGTWEGGSSSDVFETPLSTSNTEDKSDRGTWESGSSSEFETCLSTPNTEDKLDKGTWGNASFCPKNYFAKAVELKLVEHWEYEGLKGIKLYCGNQQEDIDEPITSSLGDLGNSNKYKKQSCENGYLTAFLVRSYASSMGLTGLPIFCNGSTKPIGGGIGLGDYLSRKIQHCPPGMAINGLRTRLDNEVAKGLTDVEIYCSKITDNPNVEPTESITSAVEHEELESTLDELDDFIEDSLIKLQSPARVVSHSEDQLVVQGNSVTLECKGEGRPTPKIFWSKVDDRLPSGALEGEGFRLAIQDVDRHAEGNYTCKADNGIGDPDVKYVSVSVAYKPDIVTEKVIIHSSDGDKVELSCIVYSRPTASVIWLKDNVPVSKKPSISEQDGGQRHALVINPFSVEDLGDYKCIAENSIGYNTRLMHITDIPTHPHITSDKNGREENNYVLTWETESYYPIIKYQLKYRRARETESSAPGTWEDSGMFDATLITVKQNKGSFYAMMHNITNLDANTNYQVEVKVKNQFQWSENTFFAFSTKRGSPPCQLITGDKCRDAVFKTLCPQQCHIQLRYVESVTERFTGPYEKIWSDRQCRPLRLSYGPSLIECMTQCEKKSGCTAINYMRKNHPDSPLILSVSECVLRGCKLPVPKPEGLWPPYQGFSLTKRG